MSTVNPDAVRFRGIALQSDLGNLDNGLSAVIVPPQGGSLDAQTSVPGVLQIGVEANSQQRTLNLIVTSLPGVELPKWAMAGVAAQAEIVTEGTDYPELSIPLEAVIQDDLTKIFFLRDPADPAKAIRMEADLGIDDGRWVVVKSGVMEGDEVVLHGVYELKLTGSGKATEGGHFHADGTFHPGED
jgi:multidrug efflux pump subunit AcrA (membrane-fusion protein)